MSIDASWNDDALRDPRLFEGILLRRMLAFCVDFVILSILTVIAWSVGFMTFGLLLPVILPVLPFVPLAYHTLTVASGASATVGMLFFGLRVVGLDGARPNIFQAFLLALIFYLTVPATGGLVLLLALFSDRGRCLHDMLAGTVVVRSLHLGASR